MASFHREPQYPDMNAARIERDQPTKSNAGYTALATLYTVAATGVTLFSLYLTFILQWQGPFRDLWEFVGDIERQFNGIWSLAYLFDAYGGAHRIFLPKLLFFADYYWLGGRNWLTTAVALFCQAGYWFLILCALRQCPSLTIQERIIIASLFALALFSTTQVSNFLYAMDVQWHMSNLFGLTSLYALATCEQPVLRWLRVLASGVAAALCNFTGLMVLPVAALVLMMQKQKNPVQYCLLFIIGIFCFLYVNNDKVGSNIVIDVLQRSDNIKTSSYIVVKTLYDMSIYVLRYLSSPLSREWPVIGSIVSFTAIACTGYYWMRFCRSALNPWQKLCLYISTCIIASACFTSFGRFIYPNSAFAERYQTLVLPLFPALFGLLWPDWKKTGKQTVLLTLWTTLFFYYLLPSQLSSAKDMVTLSSRVNQAHTAARAAVLEPPYILATLSYPLIKNKINSVKDNDAFLRSHELGYFLHLPQFSLGKKIDTPQNIPTCTGQATWRHDTEAHGWILDGQMLVDGQQAANDMLLVQQGTIIGLGMRVGSDDSLLPIAWQDASQSRFRAFASDTRLDAAKPLLLLGISGETIACQYPVLQQDIAAENKH